MMYYWGFDLGDGESALARVDGEGQSYPEIIEVDGKKITITVWAVMRSGEVRIGENAARSASAAVRSAARFKRRFLDSQSDSAALIRDFSARVFESLRGSGALTGGEKSNSVYVGCPAGWDADARERYQHIFETIGFPSPKVVSESRAVMVGAIQSNSVRDHIDLRSKSVLVIDIGSSTSDFAYINKGKEAEIRTGGEVALGGGVMDEVLLDACIDASPDAAKLRRVMEESESWRVDCELHARKLKEKYYSLPADERGRNNCTDSLMITYEEPVILDLVMTPAMADLLTEKLDVRSGMNGLCRRLEHGVSGSLSDEQVRIWELFVRAIDRLKDAVGDERMPLRRYYELLTLELSAIEFAEIPRFLDSVIITNAQRVRDPHYKAVFLIGCTEGSFPANPQSAGLFSDYELQALSDNALKITENPVDFVNLEIFMAYNCMVSCSDRLFLSYPKLALSAANEESAGGRLKPSVLIDEVCKLFPKLSPAIRTRVPYEDMLVSMDTAFEAYSLSLSDSAADLSGLREVFADNPDYSPRLKAVESAVEHKPFAMNDADNADRLFGKVLDNSASKVQTYYKCPFRYFCAYGLKIDEKRRAEINPIERGNLVHKVLERFFNTYRTKSEYGALSDSEIKAFVTAEYTLYLDTYMGGAEGKTGAFSFQFDMLMESTATATFCQTATKYVSAARSTG